MMVSSVKIVLRIGGSVISSPPNPELISRYAEMIKDLMREHRIAVVVGGGRPAREFIQLAKDIGLDQEGQDEVAISVSRIFAQLISMRIGGYSWREIPKSLDEAKRILKERGIVIMGGLKPGMTTDTVAALLASEIKADMIVKATDQDGVYTRDPAKYADAEKIDEMSFDDLIGLLERDRHIAGIHQIIDPEAARLLREKKIKTIVVNGFNPENILAAINGEKIGTLIHKKGSA